MKKFLFSVIVFCGIQFSHAQAIQDFTHGIFVDNQAFVSNPNQWLGKVIELRNIPFVGTKPNTNNVNRAQGNGPIGANQPIKDAETVFNQPASPTNNGSTINLAHCPVIAGYTTQLFSVTPNQKVCFILTNAVAKQLPAKSSKLALYIYCKPDGTFEIKRIKRIG